MRKPRKVGRTRYKPKLNERLLAYLKPVFGYESTQENTQVNAGDLLLLGRGRRSVVTSLGWPRFLSFQQGLGFVALLSCCLLRFLLLLCRIQYSTKSR